MSLFIFAAIGLIFASSVNTEQAQNFTVTPESRCQVYDVTIDPCPGALENKACEVVQGKYATLSFKFKSGFRSKTPKNRLYAVTRLVDLPFMDMDTNACLYTNCPIVANAEASWSYKLYVSKMYPRRKYTIKFKSWSDDLRANHKDVCVFSFDLDIV